MQYLFPFKGRMIPGYSTPVFGSRVFCDDPKPSVSTINQAWRRAMKSERVMPKRYPPAFLSGPISAHGVHLVQHTTQIMAAHDLALFVSRICELQFLSQPACKFCIEHLQNSLRAWVRLNHPEATQPFSFGQEVELRKAVGYVVVV